MLLKHILNEVRSNARLNPRVSINSIIRREYDKAEQLSIGIKNSFVSFTRIEKLGINPKSKYNTPIGIYCYPSEYVLEQTGHDDERPMSDLPFAGSSPYGNVFNVRGNIIRIDTLSSVDYSTYLSKLEEICSRKFSHVETIKDAVKRFSNESHTSAKFPDLDGGRLWYVIKCLAELISMHVEINSSNIWSNLFRLIGVDGVVDMGSGIIHTSEPTQAVIFNLQSIINNIRVENKYSSFDKNKTNEKQDIINQITSTTMLSSKLSYYIYRHPHLFKYVKDQDARTKMLQQHSSLLLYLSNITKEDFLTSLVSSHLAMFKAMSYINRKNKYSRWDMISMYGKESFSEEIYRIHINEFKRLSNVANKVGKLLTENDVIKLINDVNITHSDTIMDILWSFPNSDQILRLLFDKYTEYVMYLYDGRSSNLRPNQRQLVKHLVEEKMAGKERNSKKDTNNVIA